MPDEITRYNLEDIFESIEIISNRFEGVLKEDDFLLTPAGVTKFDAIVMRIQIIGEKLKQIEKKNPGYLNQVPDIDWTEIMKMRDLISHHYNIVNPTFVFDICANHLEKLKTAISKLLNEF